MGGTALETALPAAQAPSHRGPNDVAAPAVLGNWHAFRGRDDWAIEFLEKARAGGAAVDPLTLGRCFWELSGELPPDSTLTRGECLASAQPSTAPP